ncbi:MAG: PilZ domain-containing protein [Acidobacteriaceae bacterium]|nr:PilZ domain-containing protein [Acidobacteriaceae bacterium]
MGKRSEPRKDIRVPVRIFGTDSGGQIFSEKVFTVNVSRHGVELCGVQAQPNIDEIVGLTYGSTKSHFRVRWVGQPGTPKLGHIGLLNLSAEKALWDFPLPGPSADASIGDARDRRAHPRVRSGNSVEVHLPNQGAPIRARIGDISLGGCFVEMPNPLRPGTNVRLELWIQERKLSAMGKVITSTPGYGNGVQFTEISEQDKALLGTFVGSLVRIPT